MAFTVAGIITTGAIISAYTLFGGLAAEITNGTVVIALATCAYYAGNTFKFVIVAIGVGGAIGALVATFIAFTATAGFRANG